MMPGLCWEPSGSILQGRPGPAPPRPTKTWGSQHVPVTPSPAGPAALLPNACPDKPTALHPRQTAPSSQSPWRCRLPRCARHVPSFGSCPSPCPHPRLSALGRVLSVPPLLQGRGVGSLPEHGLRLGSQAHLWAFSCPTENEGRLTSYRCDARGF